MYYIAQALLSLLCGFSPLHSLRSAKGAFRWFPRTFKHKNNWFFSDMASPPDSPPWSPRRKTTFLPVNPPSRGQSLRTEQIHLSEERHIYRSHILLNKSVQNSFKWTFPTYTRFLRLSVPSVHRNALICNPTLESWNSPVKALLLLLCHGQGVPLRPHTKMQIYRFRKKYKA